MATTGEPGLDYTVGELGAQKRTRRARKDGDGLAVLTRKKIPKVRADAIERILAERLRQEGLFTATYDRQHAPVEWAALIVKYAGRLADNALLKRADVYRKNLVVIAAVCLSALEVEEREPQAENSGTEPVGMIR